MRTQDWASGFAAGADGGSARHSGPSGEPRPAPSPPRRRTAPDPLHTNNPLRTEDAAAHAGRQAHAGWARHGSAAAMLGRRSCRRGRAHARPPASRAAFKPGRMIPARIRGGVGWGWGRGLLGRPPARRDELRADPVPGTWGKVQLEMSQSSTCVITSPCIWRRGCGGSHHGSLPTGAEAFRRAVRQRERPWCERDRSSGVQEE